MQGTTKWPLHARLTEAFSLPAPGLINGRDLAGGLLASSTCPVSIVLANYYIYDFRSCQSANGSLFAGRK